jgi:RimJ/RimL family protein N-acetyltransferase
VTPAEPDLMTAPHRLRGDRVWLESPRPEHAEAFAAGVLASMPALVYVDWTRQPDIAWARRFCADDARCRAEGADLAFHVFAQDDGGWVGRIDVHSIDREACRGEIGYVGHAARSGQGLMREAVGLVIDLCWRLGFERIEAMSDARNTRALRFAESLGLVREGVLRHHERDATGELCDMVLYAGLRPQPAARPAATPAESTAQTTADRPADRPADKPAVAPGA